MWESHHSFEIYDFNAQIIMRSYEKGKLMFHCHAKVTLAHLAQFPYGVVRFDVESGVWSELDAAMPCSVYTLVLVESNGHLIMVGRVVNNLNKYIEKMQIWELQSMGRDIKACTKLQ